MLELFLKEGSILQNRYQVEGVLSASGLGQVYKASDIRFPGKWWALKVFQQANAQSFEMEARTLTLLNHPHLIKVVDFFSDKGKFILVMEYVNGKSLDRILDETGVALPERQVLSWGIQCADALMALHDHFKETFYYRALSPRKIMISSSSEVKLVPDLPTAFRGIGVQGVMGFAPPEVFEEGAGADERSDLYSLGAILHRCLVGESAPSIPFVFVPVRSINGRVLSQVEKVLDNATRPEPAKRYFEIGEFRGALYECFQEVLKIQPQPVRAGNGGAGIWWVLMALSGATILIWLYFFL